MIPYDRGFPVEAQQCFLKWDPHGFKAIRVVRGKFILIEGFLQPGPFSKKYRVLIKYQSRKRPEVTLPDENFTEENRPIHTFKGGSLCLYHRQGLGAWNPSMPITALFPMIGHWLWCYEMWKITGKWYGEEYPHPQETQKEIGL